MQQRFLEVKVGGDTRVLVGAVSKDLSFIMA